MDSHVTCLDFLWEEIKYWDLSETKGRKIKKCREKNNGRRDLQME